MPSPVMAPDLYRCGWIRTSISLLKRQLLPGQPRIENEDREKIGGAWVRTCEVFRPVIYSHGALATCIPADSESPVGFAPTYTDLQSAASLLGQRDAITRSRI